MLTLRSTSIVLPFRVTARVSCRASPWGCTVKPVPESTHPRQPASGTCYPRWSRPALYYPRGEPVCCRVSQLSRFGSGSLCFFRVCVCVCVCVLHPRVSLGIPYADHGKWDKDGGEHCGGDDCVCHACIVPSKRVIVKRENDLSGSSPHVSQVAVGARPSEHPTPPCRGDTLGAGGAVADVVGEASDGHCSCLVLYAPIILILSA